MSRRAGRRGPPRVDVRARPSRRRGEARRGAAPSVRLAQTLIAAAGIHRHELATLASIGALNAFRYDRRGALWQIERAIRPRGGSELGRF